MRGSCAVTRCVTLGTSLPHQPSLLRQYIFWEAVTGESLTGEEAERGLFGPRKKGLGGVSSVPGGTE